MARAPFGAPWARRPQRVGCSVRRIGIEWRPRSPYRAEISTPTCIRRNVPARREGPEPIVNSCRSHPRIACRSPEDVVQTHGPLVRRIALHLWNRLPSSVQLDDLLQAGMIGLLEAAEHYDRSQGASFETFAGIRIRGAMIDELRRYDWTPRSVHRKAREIAEAIRSIEAGTGRDARDSEVAARLHLSLEDYHQVLQDALACRVLSIEELLESGDSAWQKCAYANTEPMDGLARDRFARAVADAIASLPDRERLIISLYYEDERNLKEIGSSLGITESRVCQIQGQALLRLRARLTDWLEERSEPRRRESRRTSPDIENHPRS